MKSSLSQTLLSALLVGTRRAWPTDFKPAEISPDRRMNHVLLTMMFSGQPTPKDQVQLHLPGEYRRIPR